MYWHYNSLGIISPSVDSALFFLLYRASLLINFLSIIICLIFYSIPLQLCVTVREKHSIHCSYNLRCSLKLFSATFKLYALPIIFYFRWSSKFFCKTTFITFLEISTLRWPHNQPNQTWLNPYVLTFNSTEFQANKSDLLNQQLCS